MTVCVSYPGRANHRAADIRPHFILLLPETPDHPHVQRAPEAGAAGPRAAGHPVGEQTFIFNASASSFCGQSSAHRGVQCTLNTNASPPSLASILTLLMISA